MSENPWQSLPNLAAKEAFFSAYLDTLSRLIPDVAVAGLFWVSSDKQLKVLAKYPSLATDLGFLVNIAEQTLQDACGLVQSYEGTWAANHLVGFPVEVGGKIQLIIGMAVQAESEADLHNVMGQIEWSLGQLERYFLTQQVGQLENQSKTSLQANEILGHLLSQGSFSEAIVSLVEHLAQQTQSERVSLGRFDGLKCRILAISNTMDFSQKLALVEAIQAAQLEAKMQMQPCQFPLGETDTGGIIRAHQALSISQGHHAVLTLLVFDHQKNQVVFALTFERHGKKPFNDMEVQRLSHIVSLTGAVVLEKWHAEITLMQRLKQGVATQFVRLFGPGYTVRKAFLLAAVSLFALFYWLPGDYRLSTDAQLEASQRFLVTMPFDGYLLSSQVRAGDRVALGEPMALLDQRSIKLELLKAQAKRQQLQTEFSLAQAENDRAKMAVLQAQIQQIDADIALQQLLLARTEIKAPIAGLVVEGDLTQRLGDALKTGELLFVIAKQQGYRVHIQLPESRVLDVKAGQTGQLILQSLPHQKFDFTVTKLTPMQQVRDGQHYFLAEADLVVAANEAALNDLKPGMQGVAKIFIDRRNQFGIWARDSYEWLVLTWWRWWGN